LISLKSQWIFRIPPKAEVTGSNPVGRATFPAPCKKLGIILLAEYGR
jgi:hypothetical protein